MKLLKRHCYYDHRNHRERHRWGWLKYYPDGALKSKRCSRCGKVVRYLSMVIVESCLKKQYTPLLKMLSKENPILRMVRRAEEV